MIARCWQPARRPRGWAGSQGQNVTPVQNATVRCYLKAADQKGEFELLVPNGLELIRPTSQPATPN
jgi:hypothetical protein